VTAHLGRKASFEQLVRYRDRGFETDD
jgi:hypothetical protein